jgi:histidyl-tRNA synthetase
MATHIQAPRGTEDILPAESWKWQAVESIARAVAELYHFAEIRTPIFEHTELFHRGVGETSDVVSKETYTFLDRGERSITLRPEGTAGVVRAMIESRLIAQEGSKRKVYYIGPNFRYEKPQSGRLRQHHQFGVEAFGAAEPEQDVECILLQLDFYRRCGLKEENLTLKLNSLGDATSKADYADAIVRYLQPHEKQLSEDSQRRLYTNPIRILDSKDPRDRALCEPGRIPRAYDYLSPQSSDHLDRVDKLLAKVGCKCYTEGTLVRGFDYYTGTLWEFSATGLGAQDAIGGGGRYDNLVEQLGGRPTPAVGFGSGLERLLLAIAAQNATPGDPRKRLVWLVADGQAAFEHNWNLLQQLRAAGIACDMDFSGRLMKSQFKVADRESAAICVIVGADEIAAGEVAIKNMKTGEQTKSPASELISRLKSILS